ncbi:MAG TPA: hypothetical protein VGD91_07390, partial [Trebonia sp.]
AATVAADETRLADVPRHAEAWKRLGERLHPHEPGSPDAARVFAVARGEERVRSVAGRAELAFARGDVVSAAAGLVAAPGRVLLSVREHLANRLGLLGLPRVFANRRGRTRAAW